MRGVTSRWAVILGLALAIACAPLFFPSNFYYRLATDVFTYAIAVTGLVILLGYAGQISLGHAGFAGIGAYTCALGPVHLGMPPAICVVLGIALSMGLAWIVGRPILRLKGHYLAVATLGLGVLINIVLVSESWLTGGPDGIRVPALGLQDGLEALGFELRKRHVWYALTGTLLVLGVALALNLRDSRMGRALRALHASETAAVSVGIDVAGAKLAAFVVSAGYAALSGALLAQFNGFVSPEIAGFLRSVEWVAMTVVGGASMVLGGIVGAFLLRTLPQALADFADYEHVMLGLVMMLVVIFMPRGILPTLVARFGRVGK